MTGIQGAITAYTLVMATLMITGAKVGAMIGRKRAFAIGCVIYGCGSLTTALAPNLPVLLLGWSFLEGIGAALILPAIVALVAGNFPAERRPAAYGLVAAAGRDRDRGRAAHRRLLHDVLLLALGLRRRGRDRARHPACSTRRIADAPVEERPQLDLVGAVLSALGLGLFVFGVLRSGEWGWIQPKPGGPSWVGVSPAVWLMLGGPAS